MPFKKFVLPIVGRLHAGALVVCLATSALFSSSVLAAPVAIIDGEGFESPPYSLAALEGQVADLPNEVFSGAWFASIPTTSTAVVQSAVKYTGDNAVQVDKAANEPAGGGRWGVPVTAWPDNARYVCIDWDMRVEDAGGPSGAFGPFFGVEAYDDAFGANGLMGSLGVDATTGDVLYQQTGTGFLTETGTTVAFGDWNHFQIELDFDTYIYSVALNGTVLMTETFVDGINLNNFSDAPLATFAAGGDVVSQALTGTAFFDNYMVSQDSVSCIVPEPTSLVLGLLAMTATTCLVRRRKV